MIGSTFWAVTITAAMMQAAFLVVWAAIWLPRRPNTGDRFADSALIFGVVLVNGTLLVGLWLLCWTVASAIWGLV